MARLLKTPIAPDEDEDEETMTFTAASLHHAAPLISHPLVSAVRQDLSYGHVAALGQRMLDVAVCGVCLGEGGLWIAVREGIDEDAALEALTVHVGTDLSAGVAGAGLRSVALVPITLADGEAVGTLAAIDDARRTFDADDREALATLCHCIARELDVRIQCAIDALTGLLVRSAFMQTLERGIGRRAVALAIVDLDSFKAINDTFGYSVGDTVLAGAGALIRGHTSGMDVRLGRLRGEEFGILFHDMSAGEVLGALHSLRQAIAGHMFEALGGVRVTASIGVTGIGPGATPGTLLKEADQALYRAKILGRDRVEQTRSLTGGDAFSLV